jgi:Ca2+-binding EF-hand superfamily protein
MDKNHHIRRVCIWLIRHWLFDGGVVLAILVNSLFFAIVDYSCFDPSDGQLLTDSKFGPGCWRNRMIETAEPMFLWFFTAELAVKVVAMGFSGKGAYLSDYWNWLDTMVVIFGLIEFAGVKIASVSTLRVVRGLRPLRTLNRAPRLRELVISLIASIPPLFNVVLLLCFIISIWGILAVQLWGWTGAAHGRCRITPFPVAMPGQRLQLEMFRELQAPLPSLDKLKKQMLDVSMYNPWALPHAHNLTAKDAEMQMEEFIERLEAQCAGISAAGDSGTSGSYNYDGTANCTQAWWVEQSVEFVHSDVLFGELVAGVGMAPIAQVIADYFEQGRLKRCIAGPTDEYGLSKKESPWRSAQDCIWPLDVEDARLCSLTMLPMGGGGSYSCSESTWCGSNYDLRGNARFQRADVMESDLYEEDLNWGYTRFDNFVQAVITIFQCITMEGWTPIMNQISDAYHPIVSFFYFVLLVLFGSFFLLNFVLAVIYESFTAEKERLALEKLESAFRMLDINGDGQVTTEELRRLDIHMHPAAQKIMLMIQDADLNQDGIIQWSEFKIFMRTRPATDEWGEWLDSHSCVRMGRKLLILPIFSGKVEKLGTLVEHPRFENAIVACIVMNTVTLSLDRYPPMEAEVYACETINFVLSLVFLLEMVLKLLGLSVCGYCSDNFNLFDALIVTLSLVETIAAPPECIGGMTFQQLQETDASGGSPVTALRTFRLFRVLKLLTKFKGLKRLTHTCIKMLASVANFGMLLFLFIFVFSILGTGLFANLYHFDPVTYKAVKYGEVGYVTADVPRQNFDDFLNAFIIVFQTLSGEDWNNLMYDCRRVAGITGVVYFFTVVIIGNFVLLNLFLSVLLGGFEETTGEEIKEIQEQEHEEHLNEIEDGNETGLTDEERQNRRQGNLLKIQMHLREALNRRGDLKEIFEQFDTSGDGVLELSEFLQAMHRCDHGLSTADMNLLLRRFDMDCSGTIEYFEVLEFAQGTGAVLGGGNNAMFSKRDILWATTIATEEREKVTQENCAAEGEDAGTKKIVRRASLIARTKSHAEMITKNLSNVSSKSPGVFDSGNHPKAQLAAVLTATEKAHKTLSIKKKRAIKQQDAPGADKSFFIFARSNALRCKCVQIASHPLFDQGVLTLVLISSLTLAMSSPLDNPVGPWAMRMTILDVIFTSLFTIEMTLKMLAFGLYERKMLFYGGPSNDIIICGHGYFNDYWNWLDFTCVFVSLLGFPADINKLQVHYGSSGGVVEESTNFKAMKVFRSLRTLRPLRMIHRFPALKMLVNVMISSLPGTIEVSAILFLFFLIYSIIGVNLYKGTFNACQGDVWDEFTAAQQALVTYPTAWYSLSDAQQEWVPGMAYDVGGSFSSARLNTTNGDGPLLDAERLQAVATNLGSYLAMGNSRVVCEWLGAEWGPTIDQHFDNCWFGMLALFEISTTEGWVTIMYAMVDARGVDLQPIADHNRGHSMYCIVFVLFGSFFMVNLFVGVVIDNFNRLKSVMGDGQLLLLTPEQKKWLRIQRLMNKTRPNRVFPMPKMPTVFKKPGKRSKDFREEKSRSKSGGSTPALGRRDLKGDGSSTRGGSHQAVSNSCCCMQFYQLRGLCWDLCYNPGARKPHITRASIETLKRTKEAGEEEAKGDEPTFLKSGRAVKWFDTVIMTCIIINTIIMASRHFGQSDEYGADCDFANKIFALIFTFEAVTKLLALGKFYFYDSWNNFDLVVVVLSDAGIVINMFGGVNIGPIATVIRALRIARVLRLFNFVSGLRRLFDTFVETIPKLGNIAALLMLLYFMYAVFGMQLFAKVGGWGGIDDHTNFNSFAGAFRTLVRCSTGEAWNELMYQLAEPSPGCIDDPPWSKSVCGFEGADETNCTPLNGCGTQVAYIYFATFVVLVGFVFLNLFVAVILEGFEDSSALESLKTDDGDPLGADDDDEEGDKEGDEKQMEGTEEFEHSYRCFCDEWLVHDPRCHWIIDRNRLIELLVFVPQPIGLELLEDTEWNREEIQRRIYSKRSPATEVSAVKCVYCCKRVACFPLTL